MENDLFTLRWIRVALINFCVVALAGIVLRYKINFALPFVNQKYLLYAHSNFAFMGWVTVILMVLMINYLLCLNVITDYKKYNWILIVTCLTAYGMFVAFAVQGYGYCSIAFSIVSIIISYFFIAFYWYDLNKVTDVSHVPVWLKASLVLMAIASVGEISLAYLMVNFSTVQDYYFAALYFFLHFQYNGWFLFACFGLLFSSLHEKGFFSSARISKHLFAIMAITVAPTYFLSILWLKLPEALRLTAIISGVLQLLVMFYFIRLLLILKKDIPNRFTKTTKCLWIMASISFIIKITLQMLSIIPFLSKYAFGFRPIIIGYLHLSFLGIISFFILGYISQLLKSIKCHVDGRGIILFVLGFLIQEIILMLQGLEALEVEPLLHANIILFVSSILMGIGIIWITIGIVKIKRIVTSSPL